MLSYLTDEQRLDTAIRNSHREWNTHHLMDAMNISDAGIAFIKRNEACRLAPYQDIGGVWTQGWGETGPNITGSSPAWTQDQADANFLIVLQPFIACVNRLVTVAITQNQFDALCDFCYNEGCGALAGSTLLRLLNTGATVVASVQFLVWDKVHENGVRVVDHDLLVRRKEDQALFNT